MGSKGSQQKTEQTSTATSAPNAQAGALYGDILNQLQSYVQQNPNAPVYQGEQVAQFTPDQLAAMGTVNQAQGAYQPYMQQAGQFAQQAGSAITPGQINAAMNPYQQQVIDATMAQMGQQNAQQMSALKGTEAQQGAFGGSRAAVTEAMLGGQQNMNMAKQLAGLNQQNYTQAVAQAQANRAAAGTGAQLESGLGTQAMQLPMYGAQQQAQQGALQQQLAQQNLNVPYQQWLQQQAWTPQMLQFQAGLGTGVGSQMGGTTTNTGQTTNTPAQSSNWGSMLGAGLALASIPLTGGASAAYALPAAAGAFGSMKNAGGRINKADGGSVDGDIVGNAVRMARQMREGMAGGGVPGAGVGTAEYMGHKIPAIIPTSQMAMGKGAPGTPGFVSSPQMKDPNVDMKGLGSLAKAGYDAWYKPMDISTPAQGAYTPMAVGDISSGTIGGTGLSGFGGVYSLGGTVSPESAYHGFAHRAYGGDVVFDPTPISEQGGEDPNKASVMPPEGFTDQPPSIVPDGEFTPYEAPPPQAPVPMPQPRPESLRVDDLAAAPMPIGAAAVPMPPPRPVQTAAAPTGGIFPRLLRAESTGRQLDENGNPLTSPKGAIGIAQIMPKTGPEAAKLAGLPWDEQKFKYDANYNATLGKAYFDHQTKVFGGDPEKGAAAYNAGPTKLREAMAMAAANGGSYKDYLPPETQDYLGKIFGQKQAGLGPREDELPPNAGPIAYMARKAAEGATTPTQLAQNASILERLTGIQLSDAGRQALMAAGLRMMTTPGNIGTVLGTAGMQGMATYSEAKKLEQAQIEAQRKQAFEREKFDRPYSEMTAQQQAAQIEAQRKQAFEREKFGSIEQHQRAQEQQAKDTLTETQRHRQFLEMQPVKIGVDKNYNEVWAIKDPKTGKFIPIDPATGTPRTDNPDVLPKTGGSPVSTEDRSLPPAARPIEFNVGTLNDRPLGNYHPEVLENETPEMANAVKAIAEGRRAMPTRALDKGYNRKVIELVGLYNPQYDQSVFPSRQRTANEFKVGMAARNLTATKTLAGHLEALYESAKKLDNSGFPAWNALQQKIGSQTPIYGKEYQDAIADYNVKRKAVADEAAKVFAGSTSALADREVWEKKFDVSDPVNVQAQSIRSTVDLIDSRLSALADQYNRGMSTGHQPHELIEKKYKDIFDRMRHANPENEKSTKTEASGKPAAPSAAGQDDSVPPDAAGKMTAKDGVEYYVRQDLSVIGPVK